MKKIIGIGFFVFSILSFAGFKAEGQWVPFEIVKVEKGIVTLKSKDKKAIAKIPEHQLLEKGQKPEGFVNFSLKFYQNALKK